MNKTMCAAMIAVAMMVAGLGAQTGGAMPKNDKMGMDHGAMGKSTTYTGCVEAGSMGGYSLTHIAADDAMGMKKPTGKDTMGKDTMGKDAMGKDAMAKDAMMPSMLALSATAVDLSKQVGHKVSVTGMSDGHTFTASTVKMLASSCK